MIAVDGSKFKAWNRRDRNYTKGKLDGRISRIVKKIAAYLDELDKLDARAEMESQLASEIRDKGLREAISSFMKRKAVLEEYRDRVNGGEETQVSLTDPNSRLMKPKDGMAVCLNVQTAVDSKNKLVVEFAAGNQGQDKNMMSPMAEKVSEILESRHALSTGIILDKFLRK